jgi:hypothetical protein
MVDDMLLRYGTLASYIYSTFMVSTRNSYPSAAIVACLLNPLVGTESGEALC